MLGARAGPAAAGGDLTDPPGPPTRPQNQPYSGGPPPPSGPPGGNAAGGWPYIPMPGGNPPAQDTSVIRSLLRIWNAWYNLVISSLKMLLCAICTISAAYYASTNMMP